MAHSVLKRRAKVIAEPAGAVSAAAYLAGKVDTSKKTVAIISGGNLTPETEAKLEKLAAAHD